MKIRPYTAPITTREDDQNARTHAHAQEGERWARLFGDLTPDQLKELEHDARTSLNDTRVGPFRRRKRTSTVSGQANPFRETDTLGRPLQKKKVTQKLSNQAVLRLHEMVLRANAMGLPMTTFVTIVWRHAGLYREADIRPLQTKLFNAIRDMARYGQIDGKRLDTQIAWIWTMENGPTNGIHTHLQFACPPRARTKLLKVIERTVEKTARKTLSFPAYITTPPAVHMSDMPVRSLESLSRDPRLQWTIFGYVTKTRTVSYFPDKRARAAAEGRVEGKRCGYSSHLLGGASWRRFTTDHGKSEAWMRNYLATTSEPFPLLIRLYFGPLWRDGADAPPPKSGRQRPGKSPPCAYPKDVDAMTKELRSLKL